MTADSQSQDYFQSENVLPTSTWGLIDLDNGYTPSS